MALSKYFIILDSSILLVKVKVKRPLAKSIILFLEKTKNTQGNKFSY
jgi:hypothetical protein